MDVHFPVVELDNVIRHSSKWACRFGLFLQYISGIEVKVWSLNIDLSYVSTMLQQHPSLNHQVFWCILKDRHYVPPEVLPNGSRYSAEFSGNMGKYLRSLTECLVVLAFLCCHYIFDSYITCLTLSFNIVYVYFHSH